MLTKYQDGLDCHRTLFQTNSKSQLCTCITAENPFSLLVVILLSHAASNRIITFLRSENSLAHAKEIVEDNFPHVILKTSWLGWQEQDHLLYVVINAPFKLYPLKGKGMNMLCKL